jgi:hypothetical protein
MLEGLVDKRTEGHKGRLGEKGERQKEGRELNTRKKNGSK